MISDSNHEVSDRQVRKSLIGDEPCVSGVYARIPTTMRDQLHAAAKARGVGLNTLCLIAFTNLLKESTTDDNAR